MQQKKYRESSGLFVAEGGKVISEFIEAGLKLHLFFTSEKIENRDENHFQVTEAELKKLSSLKSPNTSLAVFEIPVRPAFHFERLIVALDAIRDPGNLGTIIRLCDWFGVSQLLCSQDTADCYNPKVVQASMGSLARVNIHYGPLLDFFKKSKLPIFGACLDGENVYWEKLPESAILVLGNEANGISEEVLQLLTHRITIPRFGALQKTESLNVATATAILLSEFKRPTER